MLSEPRPSRNQKGSTSYRSQGPSLSHKNPESTSSKIGSNIYEELYRSHHLRIGDDTNREDAQEIIKHLGHLYNTVGTVIRDVTKVLACKFIDHGKSKEKENINSKNFLWEQDQAMLNDDDYVGTNPKQQSHIRAEPLPSQLQQDSHAMVEQQKSQFFPPSEYQKQLQNQSDSVHVAVLPPELQHGLTNTNALTDKIHAPSITLAPSAPFVPQFYVYQIQHNHAKSKSSKQPTNLHKSNHTSNFPLTNAEADTIKQVNQSHQHKQRHNNNKAAIVQKQSEINAQQNDNQPKYTEVIEIDDDD